MCPSQHNRVGTPSQTLESSALESPLNDPFYCRRKCQTVPTQHLFIGNCGVMTGASLECLDHLFAPFGPIQNLVIHDGYSFVSLQSPSLAIRAMQCLNSKWLDISCRRVVSSPLPTEKIGSDLRQLRIQFCDRRERSETPIGCPLPENVPSTPPDVPGLRYCDSILTDDESASLLDQIDQMGWESRLKRRVQHYG